MNTKIEFLIHAIKEAQTTNDFLDKKAGVMVALESSLVAIVVNNSVNYDNSQILKNLFEAHSPGLILLLLFMVGVLLHILFTIKVILPSESPEAHIDLGDYQPKRLFFLHKLNSKQKITPSHPDYIAQLSAMSDEELTKEYTFELLKLSYIRKMKSDNLTRSLKFLKLLLVGIVAMAVVWYYLSLAPPQ